MTTDDQARDGWGRFTDSLDSAERDAEAARLYRQYRNYQRVSDELGYGNKGNAWRAINKCRDHVRKQAGEELIAVEAAELDQLYVQALEVLERDHIHVSQGRVVKDDEGVPLLDDGPKLAAIRELRNLRESYRRLYGLDAATKTEATVTTVPQSTELQERLRLARERVEAQEQALRADDPEA
ncbi:hypothetical protein OG900_33460 [Streptomyces sp. NBC_00433]